MKSLVKTLAPVLLLALLLPTAAAAEEDAMLARFAGEWTGNGKIRLTREAEPERILCRLTNTLVEDGRALRQSGRCGIASNTGTLDGIIRGADDGSYAGTLESLASRGPSSLTGVREGDRVVMTGEFIDVQTGEPAVSVTVFEPTGDGYTLTSERRDPGAEPWDESSIVFTPR